jgi:serine O-acetyltransferase
MIQSKNDYKRYLECDKKALFGNKNVGIIEYIKNDIYRFERLLRKAEYLTNCRNDILGKINYIFVKIKLRKLRYKLGVNISENVFEEGLAIVHSGTIVVNSKAKIGKKCRIHVCTNIGADARDGSKVPLIGNNVYIGPGAKIFGGIVIGDNTVIGANAVVNKSFSEGNCTIAGVPAKKISNENSKGIINF